MSTPWYQFSLRSLLIFTLFVAVLCSIGISLHWIGSVIVGIGGIAGRIAARRDFGYLLGGLIGTLLAAVALVGCVFLLDLFPLDFFPQALAIRHKLRTILGIAALIGDVLGGILGGIYARFLERRRLKR
jgi:hypothetical protein